MTKKIKQYCYICDVYIKEIYKSQVSENQRFYCSKEHKKEDYSIRFSGENNPNFNKRWSEKKREIQSKKMKSVYENNPELRYEVGKSNRGKKFTRELIEKMHQPGRKYGREEWTDEQRKTTGELSKKKFTLEFKAKYRKTMEERGHWIPLNQVEDSKIYFKLANWNTSHINLFLENPLYNEIGIFHAKKRSKGLVRDHILSRKTGFENGVFPEILRHPANCQIITHSENVSKKTKRYVDKDNITIEELFDKIRNYDIMWYEQDLCLILIKEYENGNRWRREESTVV